ncbi:MAG TPA: hypothetical protein PKA82_15905 [Pyrinomonadaceae bacterium]|nr:hypothetical protein [Pyrinomonadaceae bacterium]
MGFCIFTFTFLIVACGSIPNLESPECTAARNEARRFYSYHFDAMTRSGGDRAVERLEYLTPRYAAELKAKGPQDIDVFTMSKEFPKTFKIGECKMASPTNVDIQIQTYWRSDEKTSQNEVVANYVLENGKWLLEGVGSKTR